MKTTSYFLISLILTFSLSGVCSEIIYRDHVNAASPRINSFIYLPGKLAQILSLEFDGLVADYLLLKTMVFLGEKAENKKKVSKKEWQTTYRALQQTTNLDPRFWDPYVLASMTFPWEAGMYSETCELLKKGAKARPNDHRPYFFLWFIKYYFEKDTEAAAKYIKLASQVPSAPSYYATLAGRMDLYAGNTLRGAFFLEDILNKTSSEQAKKRLTIRIEALKKIAFLEEKVLKYKDMFKTFPSSLNELIEQKIITEIPNDPYGGTFYVMDNGRVYSTSKLAQQK